jgi:hypothetical protein
MTPELFKKILLQARRYQKEADRNDKALGTFLKLVAPTFYKPSFERDAVVIFLETIEMLYGGEWGENLSYWVYEVENSTCRVVRCTANGKDYNAKKIDEYIEFCFATV